MYNHLLYFTYWIVNALVLYVSGVVLGGNVVMGNWRFSAVESSIYAGFWVTFLIWCLWDFAIAKSIKFDSAAVTFGYFVAANALSFWLVSRFAYYAGFGVTNFWWAVVVGLLAHLVQRLGRTIVIKRSKEN